MKKTSTLARLLGYMWRYKWTTPVALGFIFLTTLVTTGIPLVARYYIDHYIGNATLGTGLLLLLGYYLLFLVRVLFTFIGQYAFAKVAHSIVRDLRQETFENMQKLGMRFYDQTPAGALVSRLTNDSQAVARYVWDYVFQLFIFCFDFLCHAGNHAEFVLEINPVDFAVSASDFGVYPAVSKTVCQTGQPDPCQTQ